MACGLDAPAEHMWKTSQGGGGGEERQGGAVQAKPQPLLDTGLPWAWPSPGYPFLPHLHADDNSGF